MKTLTILEPFATLIKNRNKKIETRSWKTSYRGDLLIHAGKGKQMLSLAHTSPFFEKLCPRNENGLFINQQTFTDNFPYGKIIAVARLADCLQVVKVWDTFAGVYQAELDDGTIVSGDELAFGGYDVGRFAWVLENIRPVEPVSATGKQGFWEWDGQLTFLK